MIGGCRETFARRRARIISTAVSLRLRVPLMGICMVSPLRTISDLIVEADSILLLC